MIIVIVFVLSLQLYLYDYRIWYLTKMLIDSGFLVRTIHKTFHENTQHSICLLKKRCTVLYQYFYKYHNCICVIFTIVFCLVKETALCWEIAKNTESIPRVLLWFAFCILFDKKYNLPWMPSHVSNFL